MSTLVLILCSLCNPNEAGIVVGKAVRESGLPKPQQGAILFLLVREGMDEKKIVRLFGKENQPGKLCLGYFGIFTWFYFDYGVQLSIGLDGKVGWKEYRPPIVSHHVVRQP